MTPIADIPVLPKLAEADPAPGERGSLLRKLQLMSTAADAEFDGLVELAAAICGKPLGAMTLLDETTQLMKATVGFQGARTMPVQNSICQHTVRQSKLMVVEDTGLDPRFKDDDVLRDVLGVRFYAGMPLFSGEGCALGALCVMDVEPSTLSAEQQRALEVLAQQMSNQIQLRESALAMERLAAERERAQKMFDMILNHVPVGIYLKDREGRLRFYNQKIAERFGVDRQAWLNKTSFDLWDAAVAEEIAREDHTVMLSGAAKESFITLPESDGHTSHWKSYKVPCENIDGELLLACCSIDLTEQMRREEEMKRVQEELEEANRKLSSLSLTDALTGLWNRRAFDAQLETTVIASQRSKQPLALLLLDADHFKSINDRFGHSYGDTVLRHIAVILKRVTRAEDIACRFGGEEFAVLLPGSDLRAARIVAQRILDAMKLFPWEKEPVTLSIGLAMCSDVCSSDELVDKADGALYHAKRDGRNRYALHPCCE